LILRNWTCSLFDLIFTDFSFDESDSPDYIKNRES
jgi:hypothetical protein